MNILNFSRELQAARATRKKLGWTELLYDEAGQDLIEYALVAALIALGSIAAMRGLANKIGNSYNAVSTNLSTNI